jgi:hypothetical protein
MPLRRSPIRASAPCRDLVERRGIAPRSLQCESRVLLLNYRPRWPARRHGLRRATWWRPRKTRWRGPRGQDGGEVPCSRAVATTSRSGRCMRGTRWCWARRRSPSRDARDPRRRCKKSSSKKLLSSCGRPRRNRTFSPSVGSSAGHHDSAAQTSCAAPRTEIESVSSHRQWDCDTSRITRREKCPRQESNLPVAA